MRSLNRSFLILLLLIAVQLQFSCGSDSPPRKAGYGPKTLELMDIVDKNPEIRALLIKSIEQAKRINPDKLSNPAQNLGEYYDFIAFAEKAMPWDLMPQMNYSTLYSSSIRD